MKKLLALLLFLVIVIFIPDVFRQSQNGSNKPNSSLQQASSPTPTSTLTPTIFISKSPTPSPQSHNSIKLRSFENEGHFESE